MPIFTYSAVDKHGKTVKGFAAAASRVQLLEQLHQKELMLVDAKQEKKGEKARGKIKTKELADFLRMLAAMLSAGIPIVTAIRIIQNEENIKPRMRASLESMSKLLQQGYSLSGAMAEQGNAFPELLINMFRTNESSGRLSETAKDMADHYERDEKLNREVRSALSYPLFLFGLMIAVMLIIFLVVLPKFFSLFEGMELPTATRIVLAISYFLRDDWMLLIVIIAVIAAVVLLLRSIPAVRRRIDKMKLSLPRLGYTFKAIYSSRFAGTMSALYSSGIPLVTIMETLSGVIHNVYIGEFFPPAIERLKNGDSLSKSVAGIPGLLAKLSSFIYVGEESGRLAELLASTSETLNEEAEQAMKRMVALINPIMIIIMAVLVGVIALSVVMPIMNLYQTMGG